MSRFGSVTVLPLRSLMIIGVMFMVRCVHVYLGKWSIGNFISLRMRVGFSLWLMAVLSTLLLRINSWESLS